MQRFLDGRPVQARPVPAWEHAGKWAKRRPVHAALAVVLGALVLAVLGGLGWARVREKRHQDELRMADDRSRLIETEARDQRAVADRQRLSPATGRKPVEARGLLVEREEYDPAMSILETLRPPEGLPDSRGFAWHYLHRLVRPARTMLPRPSGEGQSRRLSAPTAARSPWRMRRTTPSLMDRDTGALRELPAKHKLPVCHRLVFSPDGRSLASLSHGGSA